MPGATPSANGYEVLQNVRNTYPDVPVVMFTGATTGTSTTSEELESKWLVPVVFKDDAAATKLPEKIARILG